MVKNLFNISTFEFPYLYKFPGQATNEKILFVTRENRSMLLVRRVFILGVALVLLFSGWGLGKMINDFAGFEIGSIIQFFSIVLAMVFALVGLWWVSILWQKSICIVSTKRLTKYVYTTPFNRHILSLPLDQIVDTGAYTKGFIQAIFRLGTFTARNAASSSGVATDDLNHKRVNKKYFYIKNIAISEDLQHYISKVLEAHRHHLDKIKTFRPFIPKMKGGVRSEFMKKYPEYWS